MVNEIGYLLAEATHKMWSVTINYLPNIISAFIFIVIGFFLSRVTSSIFEYLMKRVKLDTFTAKVGINEILFRIGLGKSPTKILRIVVYWIVMLIFIASATASLKLSFISSILETFIIKFTPRVIAAIIIGFVGIIISKVIEDVVYNAAIANNLKAGKMFSKIIAAVVLVFTSIIVIEQLGLDIKLLRSSINILFASLGLGFALAVGISFGLGAKDIARHFLESILSEKDTRQN
ncbi:MAG: hypothetical protein N2Z20_05565 [Elusimicrobiales bacterium]|nr:hypothetical protein [Elusimicrobiales bacterium]